jgi:hypothetical protein
MQNIADRNELKMQQAKFELRSIDQWTGQVSNWCVSRVVAFVREHLSMF